MAVIDADTDRLVIRLTYDGVPFCGKTTSLRTLARLVSLELKTPEEIHGRTLYFDWLEYASGLYEGKQIVCQLVTVPGQKKLESRRWHLVDESDAVVFVLDSTEERLAVSFAQLERMHQRLAARGGVMPGIVVQANKRDDPSAVPMAVIRERAARMGNVAVVESVATAGDGIRIAFVLAVRLGLDRARALAQMGLLESGTSASGTAEGLLREMRSSEDKRNAPSGPRAPDLLEASGGSLETASIFDSSLLNSTDDNGTHGDADDDNSRAHNAPAPLDTDIPSGMLWPAVAGRILLHEYCSTSIATLDHRGAAWRGLNSQWIVHTDGEVYFEQEASARRDLIEWARFHVSIGKGLSASRCLAAHERDRGWRLWQVVRREANLLELVMQSLTSGPDRAGAGLYTAAHRLLSAARAFEKNGLPCKIDTIGNCETPCYVGLVRRPDGPRKSARKSPQLSDEALIRQELGARIRQAVRMGISVSRTIGAIEAVDATQDARSETVTSTLKTILTGQ